MATERDDSQERSEQATPKRLEESRKKGQVSRSRELNTMAILLGGAAILWLFGSHLLYGIGDVMRGYFIFSKEQIFDEYIAPTALLDSSQMAIKLFLPLLLIMSLIALIAPMLVGGWIFSLRVLVPDLNRLNPIAGIKRLFSLRSLMELAKALAKFLLISGAAVLLLWYKFDTLLALGRGEIGPGLSHTGWFISLSFLLISAVTILIAAVDVPFQIWEHAKQLKMTKQELKDEMKEVEGKPELKSKIRSMQRELATSRMMEEVAKADVIITNPQHFAVALSYKPDVMSAPELVAKGTDLLAEKIKQAGIKNGIPLFAAPMLARAIYYHTKLKQQIPAGLYLAVAQVLAYVIQLRKSQQRDNALSPQIPTDLPIPEELRWHNR